MEPLLHRVEDARRLVQLGRTRFYEEVSAGRITIVKIGSRSLVPHSSLQRFVEDRIAEARVRSAAAA